MTVLVHFSVPYFSSLPFFPFFLSFSLLYTLSFSPPFLLSLLTEPFHYIRWLMKSRRSEDVLLNKHSFPGRSLRVFFHICTWTHQPVVVKRGGIQITSFLPFRQSREGPRIQSENTLTELLSVTFKGLYFVSCRLVVSETLDFVLLSDLS